MLECLQEAEYLHSCRLRARDLVLFPGSRRRGRDDHWYAGAAVHTRQELVQRWGRRRNSRFYRVQPERIDEIRWVIPNVHVEIYSTVQFDGILTQEPSR